MQLVRTLSPSAVVDRIRRRAQSPGWKTDLLQMVKATVAAVVAWLLASQIDGLEQAFLAPWIALLTVHATVHRTIWRGAQTVLATLLGVLLAAGIVGVAGPSALALGAAVLAGLALARLGVLQAEGVTVATTALFVITAGYATGGQPALVDRLAETGIGVGVALVVNVVVIPPLNDRSAQEQIDHVNRRLGELMQDMAYEMRTPWESQSEQDWIERSRSIDADIQHAWSLVRLASESATWNPRGRRHPSHAQGYGEVLTRLEEGVAHIRSMARQVRESSRAAQQWEPAFAESFVELLDRTGRAVADPDADVAALRRDVNALADELSGQDLPGMLWPLYGALIANLKIVITVVDDVASARPVRT